MTNLNRSFHIARHTLNLAALSALLGAGLAVAHAQQATAPVVPAATPQPTLNFERPQEDRSAAFFSSSADNQVAVADNRFDFLAASANFGKQPPPPRRGYGRPRYRGGNTNADGSNKYAFLVGAGYTQPLGITYRTLTPSYGVQIGGGRNLNKTFALIAQFDYDHFGFNGRTLASQSFIYNSPQVFGAGAINNLDGSSHVWSFTIDPTVTIASGEGLGAYVVGGIGFYHKTANFTIPSVGVSQDQFGNIFQFQANQTIDKYTSNAVGYNGGFGLTYKISRFSGERFYAEARYVYVANKPRPGFTAATISTAPPTATNFFPANSNRTTYIPIKAGIRF